MMTMIGEMQKEIDAQRETIAGLKKQVSTLIHRLNESSDALERAAQMKTELEQMIERLKVGTIDNTGRIILP